MAPVQAFGHECLCQHVGAIRQAAAPPTRMLRAARPTANASQPMAVLHTKKGITRAPPTDRAIQPACGGASWAQFLGAHMSAGELTRPFRIGKAAAKRHNHVARAYINTVVWAPTPRQHVVRRQHTPRFSQLAVVGLGPRVGRKA